MFQARVRQKNVAKSLTMFLAHGCPCCTCSSFFPATSRQLAYCWRHANPWIVIGNGRILSFHARGKRDERCFVLGVQIVVYAWMPAIITTNLRIRRPRLRKCYIGIFIVRCQLMFSSIFQFSLVLVLFLVSIPFFYFLYEYRHTPSKETDINKYFVATIRLQASRWWNISHTGRTIA